MWMICTPLLVFRMMHDEVSDTENIRKNLAIERMIVEGCDILLDTSQTFVRQGESHRSATLDFQQPLHVSAPLMLKMRFHFIPFFSIS